ncbi:hypothetical protein CCHR01_18152 [Colletotrichum chrysophilum]|uniref:Uncharacterized protein n=1 Tax=Colletotrichum chrysophilum TaxID=1836956 RepID=A0AAD9E8F0_9PEZI|nr:hypothetical protein K456DRAFT_1045551 [Colletotrichum gloeosporioides 23]KAK1839220.1 hypothetical protein CCHR01_18152 [Colletotrichum chrysophilum]
MNVKKSCVFLSACYPASFLLRSVRSHHFFDIVLSLRGKCSKNESMRLPARRATRGCRPSRVLEVVVDRQEDQT